MNEEAKKARNEYMREYMAEYRKKNRERLNAQRREWAKNNPEKIKGYQEKHWEKKLFGSEGKAYDSSIDDYENDYFKPL